MKKDTYLCGIAFLDLRYITHPFFSELTAAKRAFGANAFLPILVECHPLPNPQLLLIDNE